MDKSIYISKDRYAEMVKKSSPNSKLAKDCLMAFVFGGGICATGQLINNIIANLGHTKDENAMITSIVLVLAAALLTGLGWYERLAKHAGAGTLVPITGFSNSIVAPAIEHKKEGLIFGLGARMFIIAGPVILYGTVTSVVVGLVYYLLKLL